MLDREDVQAAWNDYTENDFVRGLADGTLPQASFRTYLLQDYLFLVRTANITTEIELTSQKHFARAYALASYKAKGWDDMIAVSTPYV